MTVAQLVEYLKTLPQDYDVRTTGGDGCGFDLEPDEIDVSHELRRVYL
jgi:hypothetical protein